MEQNNKSYEEMQEQVKNIPDQMSKSWHDPEDELKYVDPNGIS